MVVAVAAVNMMQVAVDQVVNVVAMRDGLVAASRSVLVAGVMGGTCPQPQVLTALTDVPWSQMVQASGRDFCSRPQ